MFGFDIGSLIALAVFVGVAVGVYVLIKKAKNGDFDK